MSQSINKNLSDAFQAGFDISFTGGGTEALRKDVGDDYFLITDTSGSSVDADPSLTEWVVGRYSNSDEGEYHWTMVTEPLTLKQVIAVFEKIPTPVEVEKVVKSWTDLGVDI